MASIVVVIVVVVVIGVVVLVVAFVVLVVAFVVTDPAAPLHPRHILSRSWFLSSSRTKCS